MAPRNSRPYCSARALPPPFLKRLMALPQCGQARPLMFSTTPRMLAWAYCRKLMALRTSARETSCGVVTTTAKASGMSLSTVMGSSPVPGGESTTRKSSSPHCTSEMNWRMAEVFMGPRQSTAWSGSSRSDSMDTTCRFSL